jgi:predicted site-specific integrase-resolvase
MPINAVIYARSSPGCPVSTEDQIEALRAVVAENSWTVKMVLTDRPMPIRKGKEKRPGEDVLLAAIRRGEVQRVLVWSVDRIGRSLPDLIAFIETCRSAGVGLYLHDREIDTTTSNGLSLFDLTSMMAFHLRQSRRDRILRGQAAAQKFECEVRTTAHFGRQDGEGQRIIGQRYRCPKGRKIGWDFGGVRESIEGRYRIVVNGTLTSPSNSCR